LRERRLARPDGEVDGVRRRQFLGDLKARIAAADHEHGAPGHAARAAVGGAVRLEQRRVQLVGKRRHIGHVKRPGGDNDLVGLDAPAVRELEDEAVVLGLQRPHPATKPDRQVERPRVLLEVGHHLVAAGVAVGLTGKRQAGKRVIAARREQDQRVPSIAPRGGDGLAGLEDHEPASGTCEEVADRQAGLAGADDGNLDAPAGLG
jgi:hypothetical protein